MKAQPPLPPPPTFANTPVKQEPLEGSPTASKEPVAEIEEPEEPDKKEKTKRTREPRGRSHSHSQRKKEKKRSRKSRSPRREKVRSPSARENIRSPSLRRKEKKGRGEEEISPKSTGESRSSVPKPPSHSPPARLRGSEGGARGNSCVSDTRRGPGWRGEVPYSSHPRWRGKNKGVVKRAKQERHFWKREQYKGGR